MARHRGTSASCSTTTQRLSTPAGSCLPCGVESTRSIGQRTPQRHSPGQMASKTRLCSLTSKAVRTCTCYHKASPSQPLPKHPVQLEHAHSCPLPCFPLPFLGSDPTESHPIHSESAEYIAARAVLEAARLEHLGTIKPVPDQVCLRHKATFFSFVSRCLSECLSE